jgi:hypothetical protein
MSGFRDDTHQKVVEDGIKQDIEVVLKHGRYRAAVMLIYAGMASMAYLGLPEGRHEVKSDDFILWAERYIELPIRPSLTGEELYGARCGLLHTSGIESRRSRTGKCRLIGYSYQGVPKSVFNATIRPNLVMIAIEHLKDAFFAAVNSFFISTLSNAERRLLVETRLETMVQTFPYKPDG